MTIAIIINVLNIIFSIFFVVKMNQDVVGVALGTVIAQYCGLVTALLFIFVKYKDYLIKIDLYKLLNISIIFVLISVNNKCLC